MKRQRLPKLTGSGNDWRFAGREHAAWKLPFSPLPADKQNLVIS
jgi:hypothetical protein